GGRLAGHHALSVLGQARVRSVRLLPEPFPCRRPGGPRCAGRSPALRHLVGIAPDAEVRSTQDGNGRYCDTPCEQGFRLSLHRGLRPPPTVCLERGAPRSTHRVLTRGRERRRGGGPRWTP